MLRRVEREVVVAGAATRDQLPLTTKMVVVAEVGVEEIVATPATPATPAFLMALRVIRVTPVVQATPVAQAAHPRQIACP